MTSSSRSSWLHSSVVERWTVMQENVHKQEITFQNAVPLHLWRALFGQFLS